MALIFRENALMDRDTADLDQWFGAGSAAADVIDGYRPRKSQIEMARLVLAAIDAGDDLMVEAGTGTGKTLAYLLPLITSGKRAIVSTGTKTLQDQLWRVDLPRVRRMTGATGRFALLKGRANYVCPYRLDRHLAETGPRVDDDMRARMIEVRQWASQSRSGDLGEIMDTEAESGLLPLITSTADNCLGRECGRIDDCPVYRARERAADAEIVVVNHHLLFSDLAMNDEAVTPLLPQVDVVVMDEAHQAASVGRQFFGYRLSSGQLFELVRDIDTEFRALGGEDAMLAESSRHFERCVRALNDAWRDVDVDEVSPMPAGDAIECARSRVRRPAVAPRSGSRAMPRVSAVLPANSALCRSVCAPHGN
ncbi:MAG: ATP-dependent DNA helicase [Gammaproteobacteria bacterium]|nr:ATP-dependent DNA helicase [Gammaproteobacteria bacterium]